MLSAHVCRSMVVSEGAGRSSVQFRPNTLRREFEVCTCFTADGGGSGCCDLWPAVGDPGASWIHGGL